MEGKQLKTIVINGSSRDNGNTEFLSEAAVEDKHATIVNLRDHHINPIVDQRHDENGFTSVDDDCHSLIKLMLDHDVIVFATPLYWYGMSGLMKNFIDRWSQFLRDEELKFKEKIKEKQAYVIICGGDHPLIKGLPLVQQFQYICDFVGLELKDYFIAKAGKPEEIKQNQEAINRVKQLLPY